jgi:S-adenosylmethionine:tRNA ribosyltransferase-isomerase
MIGIDTAMVTLHVGLGTFRPVTAENVEDHVMEPERYEVPEETARAVAETKARGGRVFAVGSTTVRTLETVADELSDLCRPGPPTGRGPRRVGARGLQGRSALFIRPPYSFKLVDAMLTNFHLPKSTLIMMISALAGADFIKEAYAEAIREKYRFYSYGDCMLIL